MSVTTPPASTLHLQSVAAEPPFAASHPFRLAAGCLKCPQRAYERQQIVHGYGDPAAEVMFVGTAPDYGGANATGVPWTRSAAGQRMQVLLRALRLRTASDIDDERPRLASAYLTYLVRCATEADLMPTMRDVAHCLTYLWHEIELVNPRIIVAVGALPTRILCAKFLHTIPGDDHELHGQIFPVGDRLLLPMIDIAHISRAEAHTFARVLAALLEDR